MNVKDIGNEDEQPDEDDNLDEIYLDDLFAYEYLSDSYNWFWFYSFQ